MDKSDISWHEKTQALFQVIAFRPVLTVFIIGFSVVTALLEGIGLSFIIPIIEVAQSPETAVESDEQLVQAFVFIYDGLGIPFSLGFIVLGVAAIMVARYTSSFVVGWFRVALQTYYVRKLQTVAFDNATDARVAYFDEEGSDAILNAIVTQAEYAGKVIRDFVIVFEKVLLSLIYLGIAFVLAPWLTIITVIVLGGLTVFTRRALEPGYAIGSRVADANESIQRTVQAGTQGIRDVKLFTLDRELFAELSKAMDRFTESSITLGRNQAAIENFYNLSAAVIVFGLIYFALQFAGLSLATLGVFLFAMFQLAPKVSEVNNLWYKVEGGLPHLVRTQQFVAELQRNAEPTVNAVDVPDSVKTITFDDVSFSYGDDRVLKDVTLSIKRGEYVALIGESGAGKSTIVKLLARLYEPNSGRITANGQSIHEMDVREWRKRVAVVRQDPFIFNQTLRRNITVGKRDATESEIKRVCEIAQVTEFLDKLPNGLDTVLGDNGVRLSGGQRQRVSIARALLKEADILALDEATSDLDTNIERQVQESMESMDRDYAVVAIAHRLSTVVNADRIHTIEDGRIVETGTHEDLLENNGKYAELYSTQ